MEDLYYLTKTDMELEDIAACAEEFGYRHYYVTRAYRDLVIHYSGDDHCRWAKLEKDKLALEDYEREQMSQLQPVQHIYDQLPRYLTAETGGFPETHTGTPWGGWVVMKTGEQTTLSITLMTFNARDRFIARR